MKLLFCSVDIVLMMDQCDSIYNIHIYDQKTDQIHQDLSSSNNEKTEETRNVNYRLVCDVRVDVIGVWRTRACN